MNLIKSFTILFIALTLVSFGYLVMTVVSRSQKQDTLEFFDPEGIHYVNYYLVRSDYRFKLTLDNFIVEKGGVNSAVFNRSANADKFLASWSIYDGFLYPNLDCEYIRISIPAESRDLLSDKIMFSCVDTYINDYLNLENVQ